MQDSLSLINVTRLAAIENRNAIHRLNSLMKTLHQQNLSLQKFRVFTARYFELTGAISGFSSAFLETRLMVDELTNRLSDLFQGHLTPQIITPTQLGQLLADIKEVLPSTLSLPFDPKTTLFNYYQYLTCQVYPGDEVFTVLIDIPLTDMTSKFNVFQVITYDIPYINTTIVATFDLPHQYIAVSPDLSKTVISNPGRSKDVQLKHFIFVNWKMLYIIQMPFLKIV